MFSELVNRTAAKLQTSKTRHVSKAGRVVLIQSNIKSMPAHTMQCFQLPKETNRRIDKISRDFFEKSQMTIRACLWSPETKSVNPKRLGDLGLEKWKQLIAHF